MRKKTRAVSFFGVSYLKQVVGIVGIICVCLWGIIPAYGQDSSPEQRPVEVGVATIDITPEGPIRLAGYGSRTSESGGVAQRLKAKALAFGTDARGASVLITMDLHRPPEHITRQVEQILSKEAGIPPAQLSIAASHTHAGPMPGIRPLSVSRRMPADQLGRINQYLDQLAPNLVKVALEALQNREPSLVAWGQGEVHFATNRRVLKNGKWVDFGAVPDGPVDRSLPVLRVTDLDRNLRVVLVNYACHATTLTSEFTRIHGDWPGEAQRIIEDRHPGVTAMVAIGAGADADPQPRGELKYVTQHGGEIADEVDSLLATPLKPLTNPPVGRYRRIELPYAHVPDTQELVQQSQKEGAEGYYAYSALLQLARGETIPKNLSYPIKIWTFGKDLAMVHLGGEVVVDYSLRLKKDLGSGRLWINAYSNAVPSYIASRRIITEGGYEAVGSMYNYGRPGRFVKEVEELIIATVYDMLPTTFLN